MKAGPRRWMIRPSDLHDFMARGGRSDASSEVSEDPSFSKHLVAPGDVERAREQLELAEGRWQSAIKEHAQPPPDAGYARRLRALADAAAQEQTAYRYAEEQGFGWRPGPGWLPPQELRDAPWRSSLATEDEWRRFDDAVQSLSRARTGVSVVAIAQAFGQLSSAAWELADAIDQRQRGRASRVG